MWHLEDLKIKQHRLNGRNVSQEVGSNSLNEFFEELKIMDDPWNLGNP